MVFPREPKPPKISIHQAAKDGNIETVKLDLADGTDVNAKNNLGGTPLHEATASGHKEIVEVLRHQRCECECKYRGMDSYASGD